MGAWRLAAEPIPGFTDPGAWEPHRDGGHPPKFHADPSVSEREGPALRLVYEDKEPHWGNLAAQVAVPPQAFALRLRLLKRGSSADAAMHVWLFENDGDAWCQEIRIGGKRLGEWDKGEHEATLAVSEFSFQPRGTKTPGMKDTDRLLLGCNFGDLDVSVVSAEWFIRGQHDSLSDPRTPALALEEGPMGRIGIWEDAVSTEEGLGAFSDPKVLGEALRDAGWGVTRLRGGDLADESVLDPELLDLVVLPYGSAFPARARDSFVAFLKGGGSFLSMGGYAFDDLVVWDGTQYTKGTAAIVAEEMNRKDRPSSMNTRRGTFGDTMGVSPDQIGVFDPSYLLKDVSTMRPAEGQWVIPRDASMPELDVPAEGFAAVGLNGRNSPVFPERWARTIPLVQGQDAYGRPRGALGAAMLHTSGPFRGSTWGFFGVTNQDLFRQGKDSLLQWLPRWVEWLCRAAAIDLCETEWASYPSGEPCRPRLFLRIVHLGNERFEGTLDLDAPSHLVVEGQPSVPVDLEPGAEMEASFELRPREGISSQSFPLLTKIDCAVKREGRVVDGTSCGFVRWSPEAPDDGFQETGFEFVKNYFRYRGEAEFLCGTNQTGAVFFSKDEGPLVWEKDFQRMEDGHLRLFRILHFSPFVKDRPGAEQAAPMDLASEPPLKLQRQMDALVALARSHGVVIFLSLHDWMQEELTEEELGAQETWAAFWADRYRRLPEVIFDVQNEPSIQIPETPHIQSLWNDWREHGSGVEEVDRERFRAFLLNRWIEANVRGAKRGNPEALVTVGFLPWMHPADKILGTLHTDFSNMHYYGSPGGFPWEFKLIDQRLRGKSLTLGEFGAREMHDARARGETVDRDERSIQRYLLVLETAFGLGGSFACNWDWKELHGAVFPWGLHHQDLVPKRLMTAYRNASFFLSLPEPQWEDPGVWFLVPDGTRLGPDAKEIHDALKTSLACLGRCGANVAVTNERFLKQTHGSPRAIVWPLCYAPSDEAWEAAMSMVRQGTRLLLTGGPVFDDSRRVAREGRLTEIGFDCPGDISFLAPPSSEPEVVERRVGEGTVQYCAGALERLDEGVVVAVYRRFLAGAKGIFLLLDETSGACFAQSVPLKDGGRAAVLWTDDQVHRRVRTVGRGGRCEILVRPGAPSFLWTDRRNRVLGLSAPGSEEEEGLAGMISLERDKDLSRSSSLLILPFLPGETTVPTERKGPFLCQRVDLRDGCWVPLGEPWTIDREKGGVRVSLPENLDALVVGLEKDCPTGVPSRTLFSERARRD